MAGSYDHCVTGKGKLRSPGTILVENMGDAYEAIEEMYGMIWLLANTIAEDHGTNPAVIVEDARTRYEDGLAVSPGLQKR